MNGWQGFWRGFLATLGAIVAAVVAFLVLRGRSKPAPVRSPEEIAADAEAAITAKREEIKNDSDAALVEKFNTLAEKEKTR